MLMPKFSPLLCICLFFLPCRRNCTVERLDHPIVHYIVVAECSCKYCPVPDWKEDISELASQPFEVLEPWGKFRDNALKSVFIHVPQFVQPLLPLYAGSRDLAGLKLGPNFRPQKSKVVIERRECPDPHQ
jgi:hypothetical protein